MRLWDVSMYLLHILCRAGTMLRLYAPWSDLGDKNPLVQRFSRWRPSRRPDVMPGKGRHRANKRGFPGDEGTKYGNLVPRAHQVLR